MILAMSFWAVHDYFQASELNGNNTGVYWAQSEKERKCSHDKTNTALFVRNQYYVRSCLYSNTTLLHVLWKNKDTSKYSALAKFFKMYFLIDF